MVTVTLKSVEGRAESGEGSRGKVEIGKAESRNGNTGPRDYGQATNRFICPVSRCESGALNSQNQMFKVKVET